jgi:hypothetical protein
MSESEMKQIERLKAEVTRLQSCLADRNRQLDAMHWAWCSGGCATGMHRWTDVELTNELIQTAEYGVSRMRSWFENDKFRATWANMSSEERAAWMAERVPAKALENDAPLPLKIEHALSCIKQADDSRNKAKTAADVQHARHVSNHKKFLDEVEERYEEMAFEIACDAGTPPFQRNGQRAKPQSAHVAPEGYWLSWDDNDGHYTDYLATWAAIEAYEQALQLDKTN